MRDDEADHLTDCERRRTAIVIDLTIRLRPLCEHWPASLFRSMVDGLADVTLKYEGLASPSIFDRRTTDRLVDDVRASVARRDPEQASGPPA